MKLDLINKIGEITLNSGHSLILGHKPPLLTMEQVNKKVSTEAQETQNLGLFDSSSPNYTTYYPDVKPEDLKPVDADFIYPIFRLLSETIVQKGFKPIDFGKKGVLKNSMVKLLGQTINVDHEVATGNAIGAVKEVSWQKSYTTSDGKVIPAGINGTFKIDGKSNPRIARGIMMDPPSIHSNSVSVRFKWEPSHTYENENEWFDKLGTYHKDGSLVRVVVTDIVQFTETSLVSHGADPYAQIVNADGKIVNPEFADSVYSFSSDIPRSPTCISLDYKEDMISLTSELTTGSTIPEELKNNEDINKQIINMEFKEFIKNFSEELGLGADLEAKEFGEAIKSLISGKDTEIQTLTDDKTGLETAATTKDDKITELEGVIEGNKPTLTLIDTVISETRTEAEKFYKLVNGEKVDEVVLANIQKADFDLSKSLLKQYKDAAEKLFPDTCKDCNSTNVSKASVFKADDEGVEEGAKPKTNSDTMSALRQANKKKSIALGY